MNKFTQLVTRLTQVSLTGLDLGSAWVKAVQLNGSEERPLLRRALAQEISPNLSLKRILTEAGISTDCVAIGIASPEVIAQTFQFPWMSKKELDQAIRIEAEGAVLNGHSLNEVTMDWHTFPSPSRDSVRGILAVVPRTVMAKRLQNFKASGIHPRVVDAEGLALWNAYWALIGSQEAAPKTVLLINVGAQKTNLVIAKGPDELILIRDFQLGAQAFKTGQEGEWVTEVRDSLGYGRAKGGLRALDAVYITGGGSKPNVLLLVKAAVQAPVTFWNPLDQLARDPLCPPLEHSVGPLLTLAIGLALRQPS